MDTALRVSDKAKIVEQADKSSTNNRTVVHTITGGVTSAAGLALSPGGGFPSGASSAASHLRTIMPWLNEWSLK